MRRRTLKEIINSGRDGRSHLLKNSSSKGETKIELRMIREGVIKKNDL